MMFVSGFSGSVGRSKVFVVALVVVSLVGFFLQNVGLFIPSHYLRAPEDAGHILKSMSEWLHVSYFEEGFVRRAFLGTLLAPFSEASRGFVFIVATAFSMFFVFVLAVKFSVGRGGTPSFLRFLVFLFLLSPLGAMNFGWMFGRFEFINYVVLFACVYASLRRWVAPLVLLLIVGLLVHEAFVFYAWPLVFATLYCSLGEGMSRFSRFRFVCKVFFVPVLVAGYLALYGNADVEALGANRGLFDFKRCTFLEVALLLFYFSLLFGLHLLIYRKARIRVDAYFVAPYFCLFLFFLGVDYFRWMSLFFFVVLVSLFIRFLTADLLDDFDWRESRVVVGLGVLLGMPFFGPIGVVYPFPAFGNFLRLLKQLL